MCDEDLADEEEDPGFCEHRARRGRRLYCSKDAGHGGKHEHRRLKPPDDTRCTFLITKKPGTRVLIWRCTKRAGHTPRNAHVFPVLPVHEELWTSIRYNGELE